MSSVFHYLRPRFSLPPRPFARYATTWRLTGLFCAVWFTLVSVGVPLHATSGQGCASNPGELCRCSAAKRMSGTCCCRRESQGQPPARTASSCCAAKLAASKPAPPRVAPCCSKKLTAPSSPAPRLPSNRMVSIDVCGCGSDAPPGLVQIQEPRLSTGAVAVVSPPMADAWNALPCERGSSALLQPPVPPPRIVVL